MAVEKTFGSLSITRLRTTGELNKCAQHRSLQDETIFAGISPIHLVAEATSGMIDRGNMLPDYESVTNLCIGAGVGYVTFPGICYNFYEVCFEH